MNNDKNKEIFDIFVSAVDFVLRNSFLTEMSTELTYSSDEFISSEYINSVMDLRGDITGHAVFSIEGDLAGKLYSNMIGCEAQNLSESEKEDCAGEIINQITGRVKTVLSDQGCLINISLPQILQDFSSIDLSGKKSPIEIGIFKCEGYNFSLQLLVSINETTRSSF